MPSRFVLFAIALGLIAVAADPRAEAAPAPRPAAAISQIRLAAFMVPVRHADGRVRETAVIPVLRLAVGNAAAAVCDLSPRVRDAVVATLYRDPLPGHGEAGLNIDSVRGRLTEAVNVALGRFLVIGIDLVPGPAPAGTVDSRLAGTVSCQAPKTKAN
jgi:hypothetical protein